MEVKYNSRGGGRSQEVIVEERERREIANKETPLIPPEG
jgi:hypothetical protein